MPAAPHHIAGLALAGLLLLSPGAAASTYAARLAAADSIRSSKRDQFVALLAELQRDRDQATAAEQRHLRLLVNYDRVIRGEYRAAVEDSQALFKESAEPETRFRAALLVANAASITRDFVLGLRYLETALAMQPEVGTGEVRQLGDTVAGTVFNQFGQYDDGLRHATKLLADRPGGRNRCLGEQIRLEALHGLGRPLRHEDFRDAIAGCEAQSEPIMAGVLRNTQARSLAARGRAAEAIALLEASLPAAEATGYTRLVGEMRSLLAQYSYDTGDRAAAAEHAAYVAAIRGEDSRWLPNVVARNVLYRIALDRGDYRRALSEYRLYAEAEKAHLDDVKAREYAFHLVRHELRQQAQAVQLLTNQNQVLRLRQEVAERAAWNFRLAIALLTVLVATVAYWGWRGRRLHRSLRALADTDGLTGLNNRRAFRVRTEAALAACAQRGRPVSVLLFDLDHFKQINDQCGHSAGDWVLREVARVTRQHCREGDLLGRIGGEEFAMALIDCDEAAALRIAEHCRQSIARIDAGAAGCPLPVAASIGVVGAETGGYDYEALIAHADAAMYRSKVAGRNRVTLYTPPPVPPVSAPVRLDSRNADRMLGEF